MVDRKARINISQIALFQRRGAACAREPLIPNNAAAAQNAGEMAATVAVPITITFRNRPVRSGVL